MVVSRPEGGPLGAGPRGGGYGGGSILKSNQAIRLAKPILRYKPSSAKKLNNEGRPIKAPINPTIIIPCGTMIVKIHKIDAKFRKKLGPFC